MNTFLGLLGVVESAGAGEIRSDAFCVMPEQWRKSVKIKANYTLGLNVAGFWLDGAGSGD